MSHLRRFLRCYFTAGGRVLLGATLVSALAILNPARTQLDTLFALTLALALVGSVVGRVFRREVGGSWDLPARVTCGESPVINVTARNLSSKPLYDLDATLETLPSGLRNSSARDASCHARVEPGASIQLSIPLRASQRGAYTIGPLYVGTTFPFGFLRLGNRIGHHRRLLVTPRIHPVHRMALESGMRYQPGAVPIANKTGDSMEFIGVREYRQGDSLRKVHWKLWARRDEPVVREFSKEYFSRLALVMDTYRPPAPEHFEVAAEVTASIANYLARENAIVDFLAAGSILHPLSTDHQSGLLGILDVLACAQPCKENPYQLLEAQVQPRLSGLSCLIFVTYELTPERLAFVQALRVTGTPVRVFSVGHGESDSEVTVLDPASIPGCLEFL